ncbi:MAG: molybdopterin-dependent oxidoreductase [Candidatus Nanopelagicales bacterium]|jgi:anaerobic selenocysteine-containing dehydrogenase|nr:molybdopterin-dependent oxidoreductase [Candidatus Nanopelagicales bacterium]
MKPRDPESTVGRGPSASPVSSDAPEFHGLRIRETVSNYPPVDTWDDVVMYDAKAHPRKVEKHYMLVPTTCFNCESACGLLAFVDKETKEVVKIEGNPAHPGSRGRNCAKGPATINQTSDPERILYPMKRVGPRGSAQFERVSWDDAMDDIAGRIRKAIVEDRKNEIMYHVGRHGEDGFIERVLLAWGVDGNNTHTNICSAGARFGYSLWGGYDRPSPDHANAKVILLLSSHLESGHYFNPHAQRIMDAKVRGGAKLVVVDPRLSNTASHADVWVSPWPGTEAAMLLAIASYILRTDQVAWDYIQRWVNWRTYMENLHPDQDATDFSTFKATLTEDYQKYTFEYAAEECRIPVSQLEKVAKIVADCNGKLAAHTWRAASAGNLGGWAVARALFFLTVLTGSIGQKGGTSPNGWNKFIPHGPDMPGGHDSWNELLWPREFPMSTNELSILLPHFLLEGRGKIDTYFSRVYNPVWTNPDGFSWIEALSDENLVGCHVAMTPTWNETSVWADYVLPFGHSTERHDTQSYEQYAGKWLGFRQPVRRVALEKMGEKIGDTRDSNPGEVWEETEFWFELSWRIDPDGSLGIRKYFEAPGRPGEKVTVDDYYGYIFDNNVPGLPEKAEKLGLSPLEYMRKYGAVEIATDIYRQDERALTPAEREGAVADENGVLRKPITPETQKPLVGEAGAVGVVLDDGSEVAGWLTPSRKLELYSPSMAEFGWPEHAAPVYIQSHVNHREIDPAKGEMVLVPTFRLPTLIHTRSGNAKYLNEISNKHPVWVNSVDAKRLGMVTGDMVRINTEIGYFVARIWSTEAIRPGVIAMSHHMGRWRTTDEAGSRWVTGKVDVGKMEDGRWRLRYKEGIRPFVSNDSDSMRINWEDPGVHQNLAFAVHPDTWSGMHCWHQKIVIEKAHEEDKYGDVVVDTAKSREVYREWMAKTRPGPTASGLRRPEFMMRPVMPQVKAYYVDENS